jgi:hypothetical protein
MRELSVDDAIDFLCVHRKYISDSSFKRLQVIMPQAPAEADNTSPFDLLTEVQEQMGVVRKMRQIITDRGDEVNPRDLKDLIGASTSLFSMLTKMHNDIINQDRLRKIEQATVAAVMTLPPAEQELFFTTLSASLEDFVS